MSKAAEGISRESFAVFMEPEMGEAMDVPSSSSSSSSLAAVEGGCGEGKDSVSADAEAAAAAQCLLREKAKSGSSHEYLPEGVPVLDVRWDPQQDFATFAKCTFENYH